MQRWRHFSFSISWTFKRFEMGSIGNPKVINRVVNVLYNIGFWHQGDIPTARELRSKLFYGIYYSLFVLSTVVGGIINEEIGKQVFLLEALLISSVLFIKFGFLIWNQRRILDLLHRIGTFSVRNDNLVEILNGKLGGFSKCLYALIAAEAITCLEVIIIPFVGSEQNLFLEIAFPWDYKNSEIAYWAAHIFVLVATVLSMLITILSMIIWYLLLSCSLRYTILDSELKKIGQMGDEIKVSKKMRHNMYARDLIECVVVHLHTKEYENDVSPSELVTHSLQYFDRLTDELGSFLSEIFFIQFGTSGLCICASIYCLIFVSDLSEFLYHIRLHFVPFHF